MCQLLIVIRDATSNGYQIGQVYEGQAMHGGEDYPLPVKSNRKVEMPLSAKELFTARLTKLFFVSLRKFQHAS
jgi:hypothetical protein